MDKRLRIGLIIAAVAVAAYVAYRWYQARANASPTANGGSANELGSNLNSLAPELTAGGTAGGTTVQPAVSIPVTVKLTAPPATAGNLPMANNQAQLPSPLRSQTDAAAAAPGTIGPDGNNPGDSGGSTSPRKASPAQYAATVGAVPPKSGGPVMGEKPPTDRTPAKTPTPVERKLDAKQMEKK